MSGLEALAIIGFIWSTGSVIDLVNKYRNEIAENAKRDEILNRKLDRIEALGIDNTRDISALKRLTVWVALFIAAHILSDKVNERSAWKVFMIPRRDHSIISLMANVDAEHTLPSPLPASYSPNNATSPILLLPQDTIGDSKLSRTEVAIAMASYVPFAYYHFFSWPLRSWGRLSVALTWLFGFFGTTAFIFYYSQSQRPSCALGT